MKTAEWKDVELSLSIELTPEAIDTMTPDLQAALLSHLPMDFMGGESDPVDLRIEFKSSGYSDPGRLYAAPEDCYPPEGSDERELDSVYVTREIWQPDDLNDEHGSLHPTAGKWIDGDEIELPRDLQESLFAHYRKQIDDVELPEND